MACPENIIQDEEPSSGILNLKPHIAEAALTARCCLCFSWSPERPGGELNSFPGRQCCDQAHSLHRLLSLRGGVRPQVSREAAGSASWQPQKQGWGWKCQPGRAYSINHPCLGSCTLALLSSAKTFPSTHTEGWLLSLKILGHAVEPVWGEMLAVLLLVFYSGHLLSYPPYEAFCFWHFHC